LVIELELVTDPLGPVLPCVLTAMASELKKIAGPTTALAEVSDAVTALVEPLAGNTTDGAGPRVLAGPPNKLTLAR
jgi:hypothetical protein